MRVYAARQLSVEYARRRRRWPRLVGRLRPFMAAGPLVCERVADTVLELKVMSPGHPKLLGSKEVGRPAGRNCRVGSIFTSAKSDGRLSEAQRHARGIAHGGIFEE